MFDDDPRHLPLEEKPTIQLSPEWGADYTHAKERVDIKAHVQEDTMKRIFKIETIASER